MWLQHAKALIRHQQAAPETRGLCCPYIPPLASFDSFGVELAHLLVDQICLLRTDCQVRHQVGGQKHICVCMAVSGLQDASYLLYTPIHASSSSLLPLCCRFAAFILPGKIRIVAGE